MSPLRLAIMTRSLFQMTVKALLMDQDERIKLTCSGQREIVFHRSQTTRCPLSGAMLG
jgi:hypothetical protein